VDAAESPRDGGGPCGWLGGGWVGGPAGAKATPSRASSGRGGDGGGSEGANEPVAGEVGEAVGDEEMAGEVTASGEAGRSARVVPSSETALAPPSGG